MRKDIILFDLDGTLTDPMVGITKSVRHALNHYGIEVEDLKQLCCFIGPPLADSFVEYYGFTRERAREAVFIYREYFSVTGLFENVVYDGIPAMLEALRESGKRLFVATSKPEFFAKQILDHFGMSRYFDFIGGADLEETRVKKADVIRYVLEENGLENPERMVMVGDRLHDVGGARENGIESVGVLYGYGDRPELLAAGADYIADTVEDLGRMLLQL